MSNPTPPIDPILTLRAIKLYCLSTRDPVPAALSHIVRLTVNAGIAEHLNELQSDPQILAASKGTSSYRAHNLPWRFDDPENKL